MNAVQVVNRARVIMGASSFYGMSHGQALVQALSFLYGPVSIPDNVNPYNDESNVQPFLEWVDQQP